MPLTDPTVPVVPACYKHGYCVIHWCCPSHHAHSPSSQNNLRP